MSNDWNLGRQIQRRTFLNSAGVCLGSAALSALMSREARTSESSGEQRPLPHHRAWVTYGLGSECDDLPGFVVLTSEGGRNPQPISSRMWAAGFLPSQFQGVPFESAGDPVHYVGNPAGVSMAQQRRLVDAIRKLDEHRAVG